MDRKSSFRQTQKEATKKHILRTAYGLFREKGYADTTMRGLAEQAGIGLGTIFKHFPDKSSLLAAAFQHDLNEVIQTAFATLPEKGIKTQLVHIIREIYTFYARDPQLSKILVKEALFLENHYGEQLTEQVKQFLLEICNLLKSAEKQGELKTNRTPEEDSLAFWSFYFTGLLLGLKHPDFPVEDQAQLVGKLLDNYFTFQ